MRVCGLNPGIDPGSLVCNVVVTLHGFDIDCDRELRRAPDGRGPLGTVRVRATPEPLLDGHGELLRMVANGDGIPSHALARSGSRLLSWHADAGSFLIDAAAGRIAYRPKDASVEASRTRWEHRLGSTAVPLLAAELGALPLHASAAAVDGRAVIICGVTGRGKSTLAAALAARGHRPIAEDGLVVDVAGRDPIVWPGLGGAMITPEAAAAIGIRARAAVTEARGRLLIEMPPAVSGPTPVAGVVILMERGGDRVDFVRPPAARAHRELLAHVISTERRAAFAATARLVESVPVVLLTVPDAIGQLGRAADVLDSLCYAPGLSLPR